MITPFLLSRTLGAVNFSNLGNGEIDVNQGFSSLVGCSTIRFIHYLDSESKVGPDEYANLAKGRKLRPADRLVHHSEGRSQ